MTALPRWEVVVDDEPFVRYAADAVVVATPTGSTAYVGPGEEIGFRADATAGKVVRLGRTTFYERARRKLQVSGSAEAV